MPIIKNVNGTSSSWCFLIGSYLPRSSVVCEGQLYRYSWLVLGKRAKEIGFFAVLGNLRHRVLYHLPHTAESVIIASISKINRDMSRLF